MIDEEIVKLVRATPTTFKNISQLINLLDYRNELIANKHQFVEDNYIHVLSKINEDIKLILQL